MLDHGGEDALSRWLSEPPSKQQLKADLAALNELARSDRKLQEEFGADEEQLLLAWCQDVADAAGGLLGLKSARTRRGECGAQDHRQRARHAQCHAVAGGPAQLSRPRGTTWRQPVGLAACRIARPARDRLICARAGRPASFRAMALSFLEFEQPIAELEAKIDELRFVSSDAEVNIGEEIARLRAKSRALTNSIFANLTAWQVAQLARHPQRPYTLDYAVSIFDEFQELHGDRMYADDLAIVGGFARLAGRPVMLIGHQKGRDTKERVRRNYGMPKPEGYRKALRLMQLAERFRMPLITLIDTPGAYPGVGSEERNQSGAIARNLFEMSSLRVPVITAVIGEGGSGGALAIGVCDRLIMLQYSIYSVISPEGCASILWKSADKKEIAADAMGITAERLDKLGLVDEVLREPLGGAHRDPQAMADSLKEALRASPRPCVAAVGGRAGRSSGTSACVARAFIARPTDRRRAHPGSQHVFTPHRLAASLDLVLAAVPAASHARSPGLCIALSGGLDSTVLLVALAQLANAGSHAARLRAIHVDHSVACRFRAVGARVP